ncbi:hypothetical protein LU632_25960 (plasmid) [Erwinia tracheiphila]|uniref:hypothetical protein n=1 Tax=Erwinia tracheiphila TaxID=65700 RepID=UPI001F39B945|nr:hypothetical protein [Erwinia tracheiphila]UIA94536.1 hypothetical protein LU632_25960 [Erwinia tracheiphila]
MRYRKLDSQGDYSFGKSQADFYKDSPEAPGQAAFTRLVLFTDEWFLDSQEGTPWSVEVLGKYTASIYDAVLKDRLLGTQAVTGIERYTSELNRDTRKLTVTAILNTLYGTTTITGTL